MSERCPSACPKSIRRFLEELDRLKRQFGISFEASSRFLACYATDRADFWYVGSRDLTEPRYQVGVDDQASEEVLQDSWIISAGTYQIELIFGT